MSSEEGHVNVGSVSHILRGVLKELLPEEDALSALHPTRSTGASRATSRRNSAPRLATEKNEPVRRLLAKTSLLEEVKEIESKRDADIALLDSVDRHIEARHAHLQAADKRQFETLRHHGLLQGNELHVIPSKTILRYGSYDDDASATLGQEGSGAAVATFDTLGTRQMDTYSNKFTDTIVQPDELIGAIEVENAIRSGNMAVGQVAPDFKRTAGDPHYLAQSSASLARKTTNEQRFTATVGGFGAEFHNTLKSSHAQKLPGTIGRRSVPASAPSGDMAAPDVKPFRRSVSFKTAGKSLLSANAHNQDDDWLAQQLDNAIREESGDEADPGAPTKYATDLLPPITTAAATTTTTTATDRHTTSAAMQRSSALSGTRGEGAASALGRARVLAAARKSGPSLSAEERAIAKKMQSTQAYLRNPRFSTRADGKDTRIIAGAGRGKSPAVTVASPTPGFAIPNSRRDLLSTAFLTSKGVPMAPQSIRPPAATILSEALMGTFVARPSSLRWSVYEAGARLAGSIVLQNIDSVSRHIRILPPKTRFFLLDEVAFPSGQGVVEADKAFKNVSSAGTPSSMVAPGMNVRVSLTFAPTSSAPYEDVLTIVTETGTFTFPLEASLPAPELDLASDITGGICLVNDVVTTELTVTNLGAKAQFRFISTGGEEDVDDSPNNDIDSLRLGPFRVSPVQLDLAQGQLVRVKVTYSPDNIGQHDVEFAAVCSNGDVTYHRLRGECPALRLGLSMVGDRAAPDDGGIEDFAVYPADELPEVPPFPLISARGESIQHTLAEFVHCMVHHQPVESSRAPYPQTLPSLLAFGGCFPMSSANKTIKIRNTVPLDLPCTWRVIMVPTAPDVPIADIPCPYTISPSSMVLTPYADSEFVVEFTPSFSGAFYAVAWMEIGGVPIEKEGDEVVRGISRGCAIGLSGVGLPVAVACDPSSVVFPQALLPGVESVVKVQLHNHGSSDVSYHIPRRAAVIERNGRRVIEDELKRDGVMPVISAYPRIGVIPAGGSADVQVAFSCLRPGDYLCGFADVPGIADCGIVLYHGSEYAEAADSGPSSPASAGRLSDSECSPVCTIADGDGFSMSPNSSPSGRRGLSAGSGSGRTGGHNVLSRDVQCRTADAGSALDSARSYVAAGSFHRAGTIPMFISASVRYPEVQFAEAEVDFGLLATASAAHTEITLVNRSGCRAPWVLSRVRAGAHEPSAEEFSGIAMDDSEVTDSTFLDDEAFHNIVGGVADLHIEPRSGILEPLGTATVRITCETAVQPERLRAALRCIVGAALIEDSDQIVVLTSSPPPPRHYLSVSAEIQAPKVTLSTSSIAYGVVFLGVPVRRSIQMQNLSNLSAPFSFDLYVSEGTTSSKKSVAAPYEVHLAPRDRGVLEPKQIMDLELTVTPRRLGPIEDALIACDVTGMAYPLGISLDMDVLGVTVSYALVDGDSGQPLVDEAQMQHPSQVSLGLKDSKSGLTWENEPLIAVDDWIDMTPDERFEASLRMIDPALKQDPAVLAMTEAFSRARYNSAKVAHIPPAVFGQVPMVTRKTLTLKIFNISGIPTDAYVSVAKYPAWEDGKTDTNFSALYAQADALVERASKAFVTGGALLRRGSTSLGMNGDTSPAGSANAAILGRRRSRHTNDSPHSSASTRTGATREAGRALLSSGQESVQRFASAAGADHIATQETRKLMRKSLGLGHGIAVEIFPKKFRLPPFGYAEVEVAVVGDLPGEYVDDLVVRMDGCADMHVPLTATITGKPLTFQAGASGLQLRGALGATGPTLNFGDHASGGLDVVKAVIIENSSPRDAHLIWHLMHDRYPLVPPPPASLDIVVPDVFDPQSGALAQVFIRPQSDRDPQDPPPFALLSPTTVVPAYGKVVIHVSASPKEITAEYAQLASKLYSWPTDLLDMWRGLFAADVAWTPPGAQPGADVMERLKQPLTPREDTRALESYDRDALLLHTVVKPFVPSLTVHKRVLADNQPYVKFRVWATAISSGKALASMAGSGPESAAYRSLMREVVLTNDMSSDLTFVLAVEGPFSLQGCFTNAPKHPITRLDIVAEAEAPHQLSQTQKAPALASLFAPGAIAPEEITTAASEKRIFSLSHHATLVANVVFDPAAGSSLLESAAALFFSKNVAVPVNALSATAKLTSQLPVADETMKSTVKAVVEPEMAKTAVRLRGEHIGRLVLTFANGHKQYIGLHAEVQKPTVLGSSSHFQFGTVRADASRSLELHLSNPTEVPAEWTLKHMPAPASRQATATSIDWKSYGLSPDNPLWNPKQPQSAPADDPGAFEFSLTSGVLAGPTAPPSIASADVLRASEGLPHPQRIVITFRPKSNALYQSRFRFTVRQGEIYEILLLGKGTYEEL